MVDNSENIAPDVDNNVEPTDNETTESTQEEDNTPEWQGKFADPDTMYNSYKELENKLGSQGGELGEMRQMLEDFVRKDASSGKSSDESQRYYDPETQKAFDLIDSKFNISEKDKAIGELREQVMYMQDKQNFNDFKSRHDELTSAQANLLWKLGAKVDGLADYEQLKKDILDPAFKSATVEARETVETKKRAKGTPAKRSTSTGGTSLLEEFAKLDRSTEAVMRRSLEITRDPGFEAEKKALRTQ